MSSTMTTKKIATTRPWGSRWWAPVVAILIAAVAFGVVLTQGETTSARSSESRGALVDQSVSLPCRHQMTVTREGPTCGGASAADVVATDPVRKPHGFGAPRPSRLNCLGLAKRGITCAGHQQ
jgi:hypothetical protein